VTWETNTRQVPSDEHRARCGHLYLRIESIAGYRAPGDTAYESPTWEWFVEPDDEDKSYRRALATGSASTLDAAKGEAKAACDRLAQVMLASLRDL